jgi:3-dehydroquinate dehydratase-2
VTGPADASRVLVLNGPNLGRLGRRQPEVYGTTTYDELVELCRGWGRDLGLAVEVRQTNHEGDLLDWLNAAADEDTPVVLNAAAWSHYSYALLDACAQLVAPLVEVHLSDPAQRPEQFRHHSVVTAYAAEVVVGRGVDGYRLALESVARRWPVATDFRAPGTAG